MESISFRAPWGKSVKLFTLVLQIPLFLIIIVNFKILPNQIIWAKIVGVGVPLLLVLIVPFFMILGFEIRENQLIIKRPGWITKIDLSNISSVEANPTAMKGSIRTFGNGGLYCFCGAFSNKLLGSYRAFVTNPENAVVIRTAGKIYVVSPENPALFVTEIKKISAN